MFPVRLLLLLLKWKEHLCKKKKTDVSEIRHKQNHSLKYMQVHKVPSYQFSKVTCYLDGYIFCAINNYMRNLHLVSSVRCILFFLVHKWPFLSNVLPTFFSLQATTRFSLLIISCDHVGLTTNSPSTSPTLNTPKPKKLSLLN